MAQARGSNAQVVICYESAFGVTPATPTGIRLPFNSSEIQSKQNLIESNTITGSRNPTQPGRGNVSVSGSMVIPVDKIGIGYILKALLGTPNTTGTTTYTHVYKPKSTVPSLVIEQGFTDINAYEVFNGCKINQLSLSAGGDGELTASVDIVGSKETDGSSSFVTTPTTFSVEKFGNFQAAIKEGGATIANVTQMELQIANNLDTNQYVIGGGGVLGDIPEGMFQVSGSITAFFENLTLLNKAVNNTESSLELKFTSGSHSLAFSIPELLYERNSPGVSGPAGITINMPFWVYYNDSTEVAALVATLINSQASYA